MKSIAIVGSNLIGLLSADILSSKNNVTIIDSELELGFPASFPGSCIDKEVISNILGDQDKKTYSCIIRIILTILDLNGSPNY